MYLMPKIVDKEQKRLAIATACIDLFIERGITDLTVSEVAKHAGIGKGTIYHYFKNKNDIVFTIIDTFIQEELQKLDHDLAKMQHFDQKLYRFFDFSLSQHLPYRQDQLKSYLEYLSVSITSSDNKMQEFNKECRKKFRIRLDRIIDEAIEKKQVKPQAKDLVQGLYATEKGFLLLCGTENVQDAPQKMRQFLDAMIQLMRI